MPRFRSFRRSLSPGLLSGLITLTLAFAWPLRAADSSVKNEPAVELPKYVVTDSRDLPPPESWLYGQMPGFEILSNASPAKTQALLRDFGLFQQALKLVFPLPERVAGPTTFILCGAGDKFEAFVPDGQNAGIATRASVFLTARGHSAIVLNLQSSIIDLASAPDSAGGTTESFQVDHNKQLNREYVHFLLSQNDPRPPAWLEEGLAQIIMAMKYDQKTVTFGQIEDPNRLTVGQGLIAATNGAVGTTSTAAATDFSADPGDNDTSLEQAPTEDRDFNVSLATAALIPLAKFFAVGHDDPVAVNPLGTNHWAKQAYAFVHMCLYGENGKYQKPFAQFLARTGSGAPSESVFQDCFKMSYRDMLSVLRGYIESTRYKAQQFRLKGDQTLVPPPVALRDATQSEVGRLKGETLALAGHADKAKLELIAPYQRNERDPQLLAALGLFEKSHGDAAHARKFLEASTQAKVVRPEAYLELARLRYTDALGQPGENGRFSAAQTDAILAPLLIARTQPPPTLGVYELVADTWAHAAAKPTRNDIAVLIAGVREMPGQARLVYQTASLCVDAGFADAAAKLIDYGLQLSSTPAGQARFQALKAKLPPQPPTTK